MGFPSGPIGPLLGLTLTGIVSFVLTCRRGTSDPVDDGRFLRVASPFSLCRPVTRSNNDRFGPPTAPGDLCAMPSARLLTLSSVLMLGDGLAARGRKADIDAIDDWTSPCLLLTPLKEPSRLLDGLCSLLSSLLRWCL